jgi:hypothetical protein
MRVISPSRIAFSEENAYQSHPGSSRGFPPIPASRGNLGRNLATGLRIKGGLPVSEIMI